VGLHLKKCIKVVPLVAILSLSVLGGKTDATLLYRQEDKITIIAI
jgi:hypothetical protein